MPLPPLTFQKLSKPLITEVKSNTFDTKIVAKSQYITDILHGLMFSITSASISAQQDQLKEIGSYLFQSQDYRALAVGHYLGGAKQEAAMLEYR